MSLVFHVSTLAVADWSAIQKKA